MFTGIIIATGRVASIAEKGGDLELGIDAAALDLGAHCDRATASACRGPA